MSSILDALRKLEAAQVQASKRGVFMPPPKPRRWPAIGAGIAFAAGVGLTLWLSGRRVAEEPGPAQDAQPKARTASASKRLPKPVAAEALPAPVALPPDHATAPAVPTPAVAPTPVVPDAPVAAPPAAPPPPPAAQIVAAAPPLAVALPPPVAAPAPAAPAPTALPLAAPAPPLPRAVVDEQPPRGRVAPPAPQAVVDDQPPRDDFAPPTPPPVAFAAREPEALPPPTPELEDDGEDLTERPPADAPRVQLSFLIYSPVPARRAVVLAVNGGSLMTLHEGESTGEIEVEQIKSTSVRLRHRGRSFTIRPR